MLWKRKKERKNSDLIILVLHILRKNSMCKLNKKKGSYFFPMPVHRSQTGSHFSNDELQDELAFRLSDHQFAMTSRHAVPLVRCCERKDVYKRWGATYNGDAKQWYYPPGTDLRALIRAHPEWLQNPELLRREILLRIMSEVERSPFLRT